VQAIYGEQTIGIESSSEERLELRGRTCYQWSSLGQEKGLAHGSISSQNAGYLHNGDGENNNGCLYLLRLQLKYLQQLS